MKFPKDYKLLLQFIDTCLPLNFEDIRREDQLMRKIFGMMSKQNQFFYLADMIQMRMVYVCSTIEQILGMPPSEYDPAIQFTTTHPDDIERHGVSRSKMVKLCSDLYRLKDDFMLMSTNLRFQHSKGHYINFMIQGYAFSTSIPRPSVYCLFIFTDIDWFGPIKHGYHYYVGKDTSYFRYPDKDLILTGCVFSDREFEILKLLRNGLESKAIADKLFISTHTVDTHRRNILRKTEHNNTADLIIDLQERGFF